MTVSSQHILQTFEDMGLRNTRPRRHIARQLAAYAANGADFATDDLWHHLRASDPTIGRATVFRAVEVLVERRMLDRIAFPDGTHRFRVCGGAAHHHHITCTQCRRVTEVEVCLPTETLSMIERTTDFAIEGHSVELFGRCAACRARDALTGAPPDVAS